VSHQMPPSFLQLQKRVDSGLNRKSALHHSNHSGTVDDAPPSPTSPSALRHLLKREVFVSDPTLGASAASERAQHLSSSRRVVSTVERLRRPPSSSSQHKPSTPFRSTSPPPPISASATAAATAGGGGGGSSQGQSGLAAVSYRSSFNLVETANRQSGTRSHHQTNPVTVASTTVGSTTSVFRRECRLELFVRREAVFYNYLLMKSSGNQSSDSVADLVDVANASNITTGGGRGEEEDLFELSLNSVAAAGLSDGLSAQVDQPSMLSMLWSVSQVAKTSHLTGGDGTFFLRKEFFGDGGQFSGNSSPVKANKQSSVPPLNASFASNHNYSSTIANAPGQREPPAITIHSILRLFGNERTFHPVPHDPHPNHPSASTTSLAPLHRATSYLLTESYECTLADYLRTHTARDHVDSVIVFEWCRVIAKQLAEMHRVGVLHNNIHADSIVLCKDHNTSETTQQQRDDGGSHHPQPFNDAGSSASSKHGHHHHRQSACRGGGAAGSGARLIAKVSFLYCASMQDLQVVRGLRKQTLSQSRADPVHSEYHTLNTQHLPTEMTALAKSYSSVLPPEWFTLPRLAPSGSESSPHNQSSAGLLTRHASIVAPTEASQRNSPTHGEGGGGGGGGEDGANDLHMSAKLRNVVVPTEKSDAFLFGKLLQQIFTGTMVEFNPQSVLSVSSHYLSKGPSQMGLFAECPHKLGKLARVDEINSEALRHLITASTMEDRETRWSVKEISEHPFFWRVDTIIEFMQCVIEFAFPVSGAAIENPDGDADVLKAATSSNTKSVNSPPSAKLGLRESFREVVQKSQSQQQTKKLNFTAPELSSLRGTSKQLSTWVVEPRNWITQDVSTWIEELCLEARDFGGAVRTTYENLNHQQVEFLVNVYSYLLNKRRVPTIVDGGDAATFVSVFLNRMFPTLLMETISMVMNVDDAPKFILYVAAKIRQTWVNRRKRAIIPHLQLILSLAETLCREKSKTIVAAGYDHVVQYVGAFPQFPVHIAESERVQVLKKSSSGKTSGGGRRAGGKPNLSTLPKWAQIQIAAADAEIQ
jgi:hypothetical protein